MKKLKITLTLALAISIASCSSPKAVVKKETTLTIPTFRMITMPNGKSFKLSYQVCAYKKDGRGLVKKTSSDWGKLHQNSYVFRPSDITTHLYEQNASLLKDIVRNTHEPEKNNIPFDNTDITPIAKNGLLYIPQYKGYKYIIKTFFINSYYYEIFDKNNKNGFYHADIYRGPKDIVIPLQFIKENSHFVIRYGNGAKTRLVQLRYKDKENKFKGRVFYKPRRYPTCSNIEKEQITITVPFITSMDEVKALNYDQSDVKATYILERIATLEQ